jgi:hypothetical protein
MNAEEAGKVEENENAGLTSGAAFTEYRVLTTEYCS